MCQCSIPVLGRVCRSGGLGGWHLYALQALGSPMEGVQGTALAWRFLRPFLGCGGSSARASRSQRALLGAPVLLERFLFHQWRPALACSVVWGAWLQMRASCE